MAVVLGNRNDSGFGTMNPSLQRSASVASAALPSHGAIGSGFRGKATITPDSLHGNSSKHSVSNPTAFPYPTSQLNRTSPPEARSLQPQGTILIRKVPRTMSQEGLQHILTFTQELIAVYFVPKEYDEDKDFFTARATFLTFDAAKQARAALNGKPCAGGSTNLIVEIKTTPSNSPSNRRIAADDGPLRGLAEKVSPSGSAAPTVRQSSRFNNTFQSMERNAPVDNTPNNQRDTSTPEAATGIQGFFSPQSPVTNGHSDRQRQSSKAVINDGADDDTGAILHDPVAFMNNGFTAPNTAAGRRQTMPQVPLTRFGNLTLATDVSLPSHNFVSARPSASVNSPSTMSPSHMGLGNPTFPVGASPYTRHNYPPVNPADQNPPCNTLYVGNLPIDTSEDELKTLFSKQRGYKRLCFRTKQNGPMCFVEFEDVSFATKALHDLYGYSLHNSVKGGIRLSFSKNPLGVRSGQPGSSNPSLPVNPQTSMTNPGNLANQVFGPVNPPPGLAAPPGLGMPMTSLAPGTPSYNHPMSPLAGPMGYSGVSNNNIGMGAFRSAPTTNGSRHVNGNPTTPAGGLGPYPDYMLGR